MTQGGDNDLDARFARFTLRPLTDADVWALSMASMVMPDGNPGAEAYLTQVSGTPLFAERLTIWGRVVAIGIASAGYKAKDGKRRRAYVESYDESWGRYAVADGLTLALFGWAADALGHAKENRQGYKRIRDFVGGALLSAIAEYRVALEWATGERRDRVFTARWETATGVNYLDAVARATLGRERGDYYPRLAPGCAVTPVTPALEEQDKVLGKKDGRMPQTITPFVVPTDWWSKQEEAWTRKNCPAVTIYPGHGT